MDKISDKAWHFAFGEFLSDYSMDAHPQQVLDAIEAHDDSIIVWEPFEDYDNGTLIHMIVGLASNAQRLIDHTYDPDRAIALVWSIEDVQSLKDVTDEEAMEVLRHVKNRHDCTLGVSWETLEYALDTLHPDKPFK